MQHIVSLFVFPKVPVVLQGMYFFSSCLWEEKGLFMTVVVVNEGSEVKCCWLGLGGRHLAVEALGIWGGGGGGRLSTGWRKETETA